MSNPDVGTVGQPMHETDAAFWARQFSEHALFFSLGLEDADLRSAAGALHTQWERIRPNADLQTVLGLCPELRAFKIELYERLTGGKWLGWIFPTFVDHTRRELDLFVANAHVPVPAATTTAEWLRFMAEHAAFAAHLMDPEEAALVRDAANMSGRFEHLRMKCVSEGVHEQLLAMSQHLGGALDQFVVQRVSKARSIIHPVLATHVVREGRRFLYTMERLSA